MTKNFWELLVVLGVAGLYLAYLVHTQRIPCVTPIAYHIASVDPKFNLSGQNAAQDVEIAAAVWNDALGKKVFVESDKPELPIYFQYGKAQKVVDALAAISTDLDTTRTQAEAVATQYSDLKRKFEVANAKGEATQAMVDELNALAKKYNDFVMREKSSVAKSNQAIPSGDIKDGLYMSDDAGIRIFVYGFQDKNDLMRTLIHEFGHALGLNHVSGKDSVMYPINGSDNLDLTAQDLAEMKRVCGIK